jgi:hypothetical protein
MKTGFIIILLFYTACYNIKDCGEAVSAGSHAKSNQKAVVLELGEIQATAPYGDIEKLIYETFPECPEIALAIAKAESNLNTNAVNENSNGSKDRGIFQINSIHGFGDELFEAELNIKIARKIYDKNGWKAGSAFNNDSFKKHLTLK